MPPSSEFGLKAVIQVFFSEKKLAMHNILADTIIIICPVLQLSRCVNQIHSEPESIKNTAHQEINVIETNKTFFFIQGKKGKNAKGHKLDSSPS